MKKSKLNTEDGSEFTVYYLGESNKQEVTAGKVFEDSLVDKWNQGMNIGTLEGFFSKSLPEYSFPAKQYTAKCSLEEPYEPNPKIFGGLTIGNTKLKQGSIYFVRGLNVAARFKDYQGHQGDLRCEFVTSDNVEFSVKRDLVRFATEEQVEDFLNDCKN